jgi:hypothetical protein
MDDNGNAIIVWQQGGIFMSEYRNGTWTHPIDINDYISPDGDFTQFPQVAMGDNGHAIIVWEQASSIFKSEYRNGAWTHPSDINDCISPREDMTGLEDIAMDNNGNVIIIWNQFKNYFGTKTFISECWNGTWTHPTDFNDDFFSSTFSTFFSGGHLRVAMDNNGNAICVWTGWRENDYTQVFKSEYHR